jgi:hypothetical protein
MSLYPEASEIRSVRICGTAIDDGGGGGRVCLSWDTKHREAFVNPDHSHL